MRINVPPKTLTVSVTSTVALDKWPHDDGLGDPYWAGGTSPKPYRWELTMTVTSQSHGSHLTRQPNTYDGLDVTVGDWIAGADSGIALKIISIRSKTASTVVCTVEDVLRYNTFRSVLGDGLFTTPGSAIIFETNEDGDPVLDPVAAGTVAATSFLGNLTSRMKAFYREDVQLLEQTAHGFEDGNLISIDSAGDFVRTGSATMDRIIGSVVDAGPGPDAFLLRPTTKILENYQPALPGSKGDLIYASTSTGSDLTTTKTENLAFIQLSDAIPTKIDGTVAGGTTTSNNEISINGVTVTLDNDGGGTETIDDVVADINAASIPGITASKVVIAKTSLSLVYGTVASIITAPGPATATINGIFVTFNDDDFGQYEFGSGIANEEDIVNSINDAGIFDLEASFFTNEIILVETAAGPITIVNSSNDGSGNPFAGASSNTGLPLSTSDTFLRITHTGGDEIILQNVTGNPLGDFGIVSGHNGKLPIAFVTEQGIRKGDMYVVANIAARDALDILVGDQAFVIDKGDGEWGQYLWDGSSWIVTGTEESATVDSRSVSVDITPASGTTTLIAEVNDGVRISPVSINVITPFDGSPTIEVGDAAVTDRLFDDSLVDLGIDGEYVSTPTYRYSLGSDTAINVTFSAGGATTGLARVTITYS